jgi:hypothetical protein
MTANRSPASTARLTANKGVIMEEKRRDLNRQTGRAGGDYDEDCR